jgi:glycosyltransferase involved in cell wall biosynthesis
MATTPLVTLGMSVYNEAEYLRESLDNLLSQSYPNLEIIIADNGSTDKTPEICREYAAKHANITFVRHPTNIGQNASFNYLPRAGTGTYFAWASGHDILEQDFVKTCVEALEAAPAAVLAYPRTINMLADGTLTREKVRPFDITRMSQARRFLEVMWRVDCNYVYGMWRRLPLLESSLFQFIPAADRVLLSEMAIKGPFIHANTIKYYRLNRELGQPELEKRHRLMKYIYPHRTYTDTELMSHKFYLPTVRRFARAVQDAELPLLTRWYVYCSVWLCGAVKSHVFPFSDALSTIAKTVLPQSVQKALLKKMR